MTSMNFHSHVTNFRIYSEYSIKCFKTNTKSAVRQNSIFFILILISMLVGIKPANAQKILEVPIKLEVENGKIENISMKMVKNGTEVYSHPGSRTMKLKLEFNQNYTISFTKPGYITKTIEFNTTAPPQRIADGFEDYGVGIKLFVQNEENQVSYNQPVGMIKYDPNLDDFNYETDYSKSILGNMNGEDSKNKKKIEAKKEEAPTTEINQDKPSENSSNLAAENSDKTPSTAASKKVAANTTFGLSKGNAVTVNEADSSSKKSTKAIIGASEEDNLVRATVKQTKARKLAPASGMSEPEVSTYDESINITRKDIVEKNRIIVQIKVSTGIIETEYRCVNYSWGGKFFFRNEKSITETLFTQWTGVRP